jgi:hypothetical protein
LEKIQTSKRITATILKEISIPSVGFTITSLGNV